jgi:curved DNA-binding protein CbpA
MVLGQVFSPLPPLQSAVLTRRGRASLICFAGDRHLARSSPSSTDPYAILGVPHDSTEREVKSSFRRLALRLHPDTRRRDDASGLRFEDIHIAYSRIMASRRGESEEASADRRAAHAGTPWRSKLDALGAHREARAHARAAQAELRKSLREHSSRGSAVGIYSVSRDRLHSQLDALGSRAQRNAQRVSQATDKRERPLSSLPEHSVSLMESAEESEVERLLRLARLANAWWQQSEQTAGPARSSTVGASSED